MLQSHRSEHPFRILEAYTGQAEISDTLAKLPLGKHGAGNILFRHPGPKTGGRHRACQFLKETM
jgi:hypothetical protein